MSDDKRDQRKSLVMDYKKLNEYHEVPIGDPCQTSRTQECTKQEPMIGISTSSTTNREFLEEKSRLEERLVALKQEQELAKLQANVEEKERARGKRNGTAMVGKSMDELFTVSDLSHQEGLKCVSSLGLLDDGCESEESDGDSSISSSVRSLAHQTTQT